MTQSILAISGLIALLGLAPSACGDSTASTRQNDAARPKISHSGHDLTPLPAERVAAIVKTLTPLQVEVTQHAGTETAGSGALLHEKRPGTWVSVVGGLPLFRTEDKYESGTGWPSFTKPIDPDHVILKKDQSGGMSRTEVLDARSGAHLGHLFDDGPQPTGMRYCMNSAALRFIPDGEAMPVESQALPIETAYFAGGCFWGTEDTFQQVPGVVDAESGYMGGTTENPTYKQVCTGTTNHAETVRVTFLPSKVTYKELLHVFFENHDATQVDRQGPDYGTQYRSVVFAANDAQKTAAEAFIKELQGTPHYQGRTIATRVVAPGPRFWRAEEYHQDYHLKHGGSCKVKGL